MVYPQLTQTNTFRGGETNSEAVLKRANEVKHILVICQALNHWAYKFMRHLLGKES